MVDSDPWKVNTYTIPGVSEVRTRKELKKPGPSWNKKKIYAAAAIAIIVLLLLFLLGFSL
jgi:hypothetical protein